MGSSSFQNLESFKTVLEGLSRGEYTNFRPYLHEVIIDDEVDETCIRTYCYCLKLDGNGRPRLNDLIDKTTNYILNYAIPRSSIDKAIKHAHDTGGDTSEIVKLQNQARKLFNHLKNSGEGGELLLFALTESILKLPQLLCKMDLKTSEEMHVQGVDGIHCGVTEDEKKLGLYWGESKVHNYYSEAIDDCMSSISKILLSASASEKPIARDLQLLTRRLDLADEKLQNKLLHFIDSDEEGWNFTEMRGVCLVAFDYENYPRGPSGHSISEIAEQVKESFISWKRSLRRRAKNYKIEQFHMNFFLLPVTSAEEFRRIMQIKIGNQDE